MILIQDLALQIWQIVVNDQGIVDTTEAAGTPQLVFLNDASGNSWQVLVVTVNQGGQIDNGILKAQQVAPGNYPQALQIVSSDGTKLFNLTITTGGILQPIQAASGPTTTPASTFKGTAYVVPLANSPQTFAITLNGVQYNCRIRFCWPCPLGGGAA